jgi:hypothetical protein
LEGIDFYSRDEFNTWQMFPKNLRVIEAGNGKMRIKYSPSKGTLRRYGSREHGRYFSL